MNVSACLVTRGDVYMEPLMETFPPDWEVLVWNNGVGKLTRWFKNDGMEDDEQYEPYWQHDMSVKQMPVSDLAVYGRYAAIEYASHDLIYVQDDDVIVSDPQAIVDTHQFIRECEHGPSEERIVVQGTPGWICRKHSPIRFSSDAVVCNMPQEFRPHYPDSGLVGFGAAFHRDAPKRAFDRFMEFHDHMIPLNIRQDVFWRRADNVFTTLTPRVLVDVPKQDLPYASDEGRMYRQDSHVGERDRFIALARAVRDAG